MARDVLDWLLEQAPEERSTDAWLAGLAERLREAGIPVWRLSTTLLSFDPYVTGAQYRWVEGEGVTIVQRVLGLFEDDIYKGSPVQLALETGADARCRLDLPEAELRFRTLVEFSRGGGTDYLILALPMAEALGSAKFHVSQSRGWISFTTRAAGGFTDGQLEALVRLRAALALRLALETSKASTRSLLRAYLGPNAARRVLEGEFRRGSSAPIDAVIWYCDMRGFTELSDRVPAEQVVRVLDHYFEAIARPIEDEGGEVLKFIGDAVLAIFPVGPGGAAAAAQAQAALRAVARARENLAALNAAPRPPEEPALGYGIALHAGEVMYGNIGSRSRLDFTVIGAPVNEVCRVEPLTRALGEDVLLTEQFVRAARLPEGAVEDLGLHALKGVAAPRRVFRLAAVPIAATPD